MGSVSGRDRAAFAAMTAGPRSRRDHGGPPAYIRERHRSEAIAHAKRRGTTQEPSASATPEARIRWQPAAARPVAFRTSLPPRRRRPAQRRAAPVDRLFGAQRILACALTVAVLLPISLVCLAVLNGPANLPATEPAAPIASYAAAMSAEQAERRIVRMLPPLTQPEAPNLAPPTPVVVQLAALAYPSPPPRIAIPERPSLPALGADRPQPVSLASTSTAGEPRLCLAAAEPTPLSTPPADFGLALAQAARAQVSGVFVYQARYVRIGYPGGDVSSFYGVCSDVVIRAYRALGIDLQVEVQAARVGRGDTSIDHRRTETLRRFFERRGVTLPVSEFGEDYLPGDIVTYYRPQNKSSTAHIAIVSDELAPSGRPLIIHNRGFGVQLEDALFVDAITGHYRYRGTVAPDAVAAADDGRGLAAQGAPSVRLATLRGQQALSRAGALSPAR